MKFFLSLSVPTNKGGPNPKLKLSTFRGGVTGKFWGWKIDRLGAWPGRSRSLKWVCTPTTHPRIHPPPPETWNWLVERGTDVARRYVVGCCSYTTSDGPNGLLVKFYHIFWCCSPLYEKIGNFRRQPSQSFLTLVFLFVKNPTQQNMNLRMTWHHQWFMLHDTHSSYPSRRMAFLGGSTKFSFQQFHSWTKVPFFSGMGGGCGAHHCIVSIGAAKNKKVNRPENCCRQGRHACGTI